MPHAMKSRLEIRYCTQCGWLLRSAWLAQEALSTFANDLVEVALIPGDIGQFEIRHGADVLWDRKRDEGFPDAAELKRRIRDAIAPQRSLGHVDD
jgi:selenoprotein W-related protein